MPSYLDIVFKGRINKLEERISSLEEKLHSSYNPRRAGADTFHKVGERYRLRNQEEFILANVAPRQVALISLRAGVRWRDGVTVSNTNEITSSDVWQEIVGSGNFTRIA